MTTIAYRDGLLAADTGVCSNNGGCVAFMTKIAKGPGGILGGACGRGVFGEAFLAWVRSGRYGASPEAKDGDLGIVVTPDGQIHAYEDGGMVTLRGPYFAIGSGMSEALGAMFAGATAEQAIHAAMAHDDGTFGDVEFLRHD